MSNYEIGAVYRYKDSIVKKHHSKTFQEFVKMEDHYVKSPNKFQCSVLASVRATPLEEVVYYVDKGVLTRITYGCISFNTLFLREEYMELFEACIHQKKPKKDCDEDGMICNPIDGHRRFL